MLSPTGTGGPLGALAQPLPHREWRLPPPSAGPLITSRRRQEPQV